MTDCSKLCARARLFALLMGSRDDFARIVRWRILCAGAHLLVASLAEGVAEPLQTLVKTVTGGSASRLDVLWEEVSKLYFMNSNAL